MRRAVRVDAQLGVGREAGIDLGGNRRQFVFQRGGEVLAAFRDAERGAVGGQPRLALRPGQKLGAVVGEILGADDVEIAGLQGVGQVDEDADLERAPVESDRSGSALGDKALPALGGKAEIDVVRHFIAARVAMPAHDRQAHPAGWVLRRRADVHQVEQPEQQAAVPGVDRPEQRQVIVAMPGGHGFALLGQGLDTALLRRAAF